MNSNIQRFLRESGLKILAVADLSACEYSLLTFLLNSAMTGLENLLSSESEIASIIGYTPREVRQTIEDLHSRNFIKSRYGSGTAAPNMQSLSLQIQWDLDRWKLGIKEIPTHNEAIILPFRRPITRLAVVEDGRQDGANSHSNTVKNEADGDTHDRILDAFRNGRDLDEREMKLSQEIASALIAAHPIDQILILIRHFGRRIPTLSLLASNWAQYAEQYEDEHLTLDFVGLRQKHHELDQKVRDASCRALERREQTDLSEEESNVLNVLANHRHPRRQLFWAFQMRNRYPKLSDFFKDTQSLMLPITQDGTVVKMPTD
jgi:hypothetical protein